RLVRPAAAGRRGNDDEAVPRRPDRSRPQTARSRLTGLLLRHRSRRDLERVFLITFQSFPPGEACSSVNFIVSRSQVTRSRNVVPIMVIGASLTRVNFLPFNSPFMVTMKPMLSTPV